MRALLRAIVRLLARLGLGRNYHHVDLGAALHLTAEVLDSTSGGPVVGAAVSVERPPEGRENQPFRVGFGHTDANGRIDATLPVRWSNEVRDVYTEHPDPPGMKTIVEKPGYQTHESRFQIHNLPTDAHQAALLDLGQVSLSV